ncbi:hypothetical protein BSKO_00552 [Bryopsis sp. KO-2023]|nr:hypothetical protein BSKO_00552 [Bryopsis sp. KO-2023]
MHASSLLPQQCNALRRAKGGRTVGVRRGPVAVRAIQAAPSTAPAVGEGPIIIDGQVAHSASKESLELLKSMDGYIEENVVPLLKPVEKCWQATDLLPLPHEEQFIDEIKELRERSEALPIDYLVVLVGDTITEEALPTYMTMLNALDGVRDETGAQQSCWGRWTRAWTAEENRHGDALNKYLYLSGRVDMRAMEITIQNLIGSGMDPKTENNPYMGFIYTSFQERATRVSHGNCANHAKKLGDETLSKMCGLIASDEARHETAYKKIVDELFRLDPSGAMCAFESMMRKQIVMPAHLMNDCAHEDLNGGRNLFADYSSVAERVGVYTANDYADIMENLIARWHVTNLTGLSEEAMAAQEYVCKMPPRIRKLADRASSRKNRGKIQEAKFSWLFNESVKLYGTK